MKVRHDLRACLAMVAVLSGLFAINDVPAAFAETKQTLAAASELAGAWSHGKSPQPTKKEWLEESKEIHLEKNLRFHGVKASRCRARFVREWLSVSCEDRTAALQLVGGDAKDVYYSIGSASEETGGMPGKGEVVLAVREGTSRVIQWWTFGPGYDGPLTVMGSVFLQQMWVEGEPQPSFVLSDVLHEPIRTATQEGK